MGSAFTVTLTQAQARVLGMALNLFWDFVIDGEDLPRHGWNTRDIYELRRAETEIRERAKDRADGVVIGDDLEDNVSGIRKEPGPMSQDPPYLTIEDVASLFGRNVAALYAERHRREGVGSLGVAVGKRIYWRRSDIEDWFTAQADAQAKAAEAAKR